MKQHKTKTKAKLGHMGVLNTDVKCEGKHVTYILCFVFLFL